MGPVVGPSAAAAGHAGTSSTSGSSTARQSETYERITLLPLLRERLLQELHALDGDVFVGRLDLPPDGGGAGDDLHVGREALDHDVAVVLDRLQRLDDLGPGDVIAAGRAAVAAARVHVRQQLADLLDRLGLVLLLDVHVE